MWWDRPHPTYAKASVGKALPLSGGEGCEERMYGVSEGWLPSGEASVGK